MKLNQFSAIPEKTNNPEVFTAATDTFLSELPTFVDQVNASVSSINQAIESGSLMDSLANFKGDWADLTGAASIPFSVFHNNSFWQLVEDVADISTEEPSSLSTVWAEAKKSGSYRTITSSSDVILQANDPLTLNITMTVDSLSLILHDATLRDTGIAFFVRNNGAYSFTIKNNNGDIVGVCEPNKLVSIICSDNSSSNGIWIVSEFDIISGFLVGFDEVFNSASTSYISTTRLTDTKAVVCYMDGGNSNKGTACVLDISGSTITAGSEVVFNDGATIFISVSKLTDTKAVVCYEDNGNSGKGTACVLDISGSTITAGSEVVFNDAQTRYNSVSKLTDTKAIVSYADDGNSNKGTVCVLDISGSTITAGSEVVVNDGLTNFTSVSKLTDTKAVVCYANASNSNKGTACVLDISGSTITAGSEVVFNDGGTTSYISTSRLTENSVIVCYKNAGNSNKGTACVLDISGSTITVGGEDVFNDGVTSYISVSSISDTKAVVCYKDEDASDYGTANILIPIKDN